MRIDAHQHFWRYDAAEYGWIDESMQSLRRDFLPQDLKRELDLAGFDGAIAVQARQTLDETRWLLQLAETSSFILGVIGWVDLNRWMYVHSSPSLPAIRTFSVFGTLFRVSLMIGPCYGPNFFVKWMTRQYAAIHCGTPVVLTIHLANRAPLRRHFLHRFRGGPRETINWNSLQFSHP